MGDFFHGWRRKTGCVTLLMAVAFMAGWVRSFSVGDDFKFASGLGHYFLLTSYSGEIQFLRWEDRYPQPNFVFWRSWRASEAHWSQPEPLRDLTGFNLSRVIRSTRFTLMIAPTTTTQLIGFVCPYWVIVIPLTLLSGFLLLMNGRVLKPNVVGLVSNPERLES
ncbi:MAG: hypothetical protein WCH39_13415 [Schlesneria sp.]